MSEDGVYDEQTDRTMFPSYKLGRTVLEHGAPFKVKGTHEVFLFLRRVVKGPHEWVEAVDKDGRARAFSLDRLSKAGGKPFVVRGGSPTPRGRGQR